MPVAPKTSQEIADTAALIDAPRIREQLERLLAHPLFANSKRYPALLSYTVEQTLLGNAGELKERSIAVEVVGRAPTYDANADPVVRITAAEVRKRLTQYYYDPTHRGELIIELPIGSYQPFFREPDRMADIPVLEAEAADEPDLPIALPPQPRPLSRIWKYRWLLSAAGAVVVLLAGSV